MVFGMAGGSIFAFNTDGTGFHVLHTGAGDSSLTLVGNKFFGVDFDRVYSIYRPGLFD